MKTIDTYYIKRNNAYIWLNHNQSPLPTDEIVEVRKMIIADEGKVLTNKAGEIVGQCIWKKDRTKYLEIDEPPVEDINEEEE